MRPIQRAIGIAAIGACVLASLPSGAVNTVYEYDELGRLIAVTRPDGTVTNYTLDPAGNRTQVAELLGQATPPASISVPTSSSTGSYSVSWTAGTGAVTSYELWESSSASFSPQSRVFAGPGTGASISGHGNGTFYYRVRGCNGSACTAYRTGSNGVTVTLPAPPGAPGGITAPPANNTGSFPVSWGTASGVPTTYQLYEATNSSFTGQTLVYGSTGTNTSLSGRGNGTYYYRARACNAGGCGGHSATASTVVTLPPPPPTGLAYTQNSPCSFRPTWNASAGATSYTVRDWSGNFQFSASASPATYDFCNAPGYTGNPTDYRPKWVKACNGSACSSQVNFP